MRRLVYISRNYKGSRSGGYKARIDVEDVLCSVGATNLGLKRTFRRNKVYDFLSNLAGIVSYMLKIRRDDVLLLQYPVKKYYRFLCRYAHLRGASVITLVHDLGSFRRHKLTIPCEIKKLSLSDVVVAANANTERWLRENGFTKPVVQQIAWDFLSEARPATEDSNPLSVLFVGNCAPSRNGYLYKLSDSLDLRLYGGGIAGDLPSHIHGYGNCDSDRIITEAPGHFGLIWYDDSLDHTSEGYIGDYIIYCNSHKLALYMRAGKPVIIWSGAGVAPFVKSLGIGICVDSLKDLPTVLNGLTDRDYEAMKTNVTRVSSEMSRGQYTRRWLDSARRLLEH